MPGYPLHRSTPPELRERLEAERTGLPFLIFRTSQGEQRIVLLGEHRDRLVIGRGEDTDLRLSWDGEVSRVHAFLDRVGEEWTLVDDGLSRNGSFVNGERIHGRRRLEHGDELRLGETRPHLPPPGRPRGGLHDHGRRARRRPRAVGHPAPRPDRPRPPVQGRHGLHRAGHQPRDRRGAVPQPGRGEGPPARPVPQVRGRRPPAERQARRAGRARAGDGRDLAARAS